MGVAALTITEAMKSSTQNEHTDVHLNFVVGGLPVESSIIVVHGTHEVQICSTLGYVGTPVKSVIRPMLQQLANMSYGKQIN